MFHPVLVNFFIHPHGKDELEEGCWLVWVLLSREGTEHNGSTSPDSVILRSWVAGTMVGTAGSCCIVRLVLGEVIKIEIGAALPVSIL